jgi:UDP-hydrolysing UDP-N-acetyl-D-glucosamine 2-epimerase
VRSILFITGSRADFGLWLPVLGAVGHHPDLDPRLLVTGMHLDPRFGLTAREVLASGFPVVAEVASTPEGDSLADMAAAVGVATAGMAAAVAAEAPDWMMVIGDRGEQLAAAIVATHLGIPLAHVAGGDRTLGAVDDTVRDMISRGANLHFPTSNAAASRLRSLGEEDWRIRVVGSPALDDLRELASGEPEPVRERWGLPLAGSYIILLQHPETRGNRDQMADFEASLSAIGSIGLPVLAILPNADAGGRAMANQLVSQANRLSIHPSIPRRDFAILLRHAAALVGNSSAGLTEAALLSVPAVNVGRRQAGRVRGDNVLDVEADSGQIEAGIRRALDPTFRARLSGTSPHGAGGAARRIADTLAREPIGERLLIKNEP